MRSLKYFIDPYFRYRRWVDQLEAGTKDTTDWTSKQSLDIYTETMWEESETDWIEPDLIEWNKLNIFYLANPSYDPETKKDIRKLLPDAQSPILYVDWSSSIIW